MSKDGYLKLVGFETPEQAYRKIKEWTSDLSDDEHFIRSVIFDIHAGIEARLRQILYHYFKPLTFTTGKEGEDDKVLGDLEKMVTGLSFGQMYRLLWPILKNWPFDIDSLKPLNELRNQAAHVNSIKKVSYKGRNPFTDADCFAQVFFDAWVVRGELAKFFEKRVSGPQEQCKMYYEAYKKLEETKESE